MLGRILVTWLERREKKAKITLTRKHCNLPVKRKMNEEMSITYQLIATLFWVLSFCLLLNVVMGALKGTLASWLPFLRTSLARWAHNDVLECSIVIRLGLHSITSRINWACSVFFTCRLQNACLLHNTATGSHASSPNHVIDLCWGRTKVLLLSQTPNLWNHWLILSV